MRQKSRTTGQFRLTGGNRQFASTVRSPGPDCRLGDAEYHHIGRLDDLDIVERSRNLRAVRAEEGHARLRVEPQERNPGRIGHRGDFKRRGDLNSVQFGVFFALVLLTYRAVPRKRRNPAATFGARLVQLTAGSSNRRGRRHSLDR